MHSQARAATDSCDTSAATGANDAAVAHLDVGVSDAVARCQEPLQRAAAAPEPAEDDDRATWLPAQVDGISEANGSSARCDKLEQEQAHAAAWSVQRLDEPEAAGDGLARTALLPDSVAAEHGAQLPVGAEMATAHANAVSDDSANVKPGGPDGHGGITGASDAGGTLLSRQLARASGVLASALATASRTAGAESTSQGGWAVADSAPNLVAPISKRCASTRLPPSGPPTGHVRAQATRPVPLSCC